MDERDLEKLLRNRPRVTFRRNGRCPDEIELAAYVDHQLEGAARESISAHLANCDSCLSQVAFLLQAMDWANPDQVPADIFRRARSLVPPKSVRASIWNWRWVTASAAAACLVLLVVLIALRFGAAASGQRSERTTGRAATSTGHSSFSAKFAGNTPRSSAAFRYKTSPGRAGHTGHTKWRSGSVADSRVPRDGATLRRSELDFRWQPVANTVFYDVRLVTADGDLIQETRTEDTHLRIAGDVQLVPGGKYFVSIRAHVREGKTVKSEIVSFRISDR